MRNRLLCLILASAIATLPALSQNVSSTIVGKIHDATGASIPKARVSVTNEGTGIETKTETGSDGEYTLPGLPFGQYTIRIEATGFRENIVKGLTLLPTRTFRQDFSLEVGNVQQTVEVAANAPVLNTENATIGNIMPHFPCQVSGPAPTVTCKY